MAVEQNEILISPNEGAHLPVLDIVHKVTAEATGGSLKIEEWGLPPGEMIPPHTHAREDECSYVLQGDLTCYVGGEVLVAPTRLLRHQAAGSSTRLLQRRTGRPVRVMEILTPGHSFEGYFDEYEEIASRKMSAEEHKKERRAPNGGTLRNNLARCHDPRSRSQLRHRWVTRSALAATCASGTGP